MLRKHRNGILFQNGLRVLIGYDHLPGWHPLYALRYSLPFLTLILAVKLALELISNSNLSVRYRTYKLYALGL